MISPTLLNEASFNYNGNRINIIPVGLDFRSFGLHVQPVVLRSECQQPHSLDQSERKHGSATTPRTGLPWINKADDYQLRDDVSWTKGAHQLKFGFSWALYKKAQDWFANTQGNFNFNGSFTTPAACVSSPTQACGLDFADFLLGYGQQYTENAIKSSGQWNNVSWAAYVQDNWRATSRLTLNLGLRWDGIPHTYEANNRSANFYPNLYNQSLRATFDNNGNICSGPTDPGCTAASPGLGTSPEPILAGLQFYTNGMGIGGVNGIPKNSGGQLLGRVRSPHRLCL